MTDNKSPPEPQAGDPMYGDDPTALSDKEKAAIKAEVLKELRAEAKKSAKQRFRELEERRLRFEEGMSMDGPEGEIVNLSIELAEHSSCIKINGRDFWHGRTYQVPRHVARYLSEVMWRGWTHQYEIDGKTRMQFYQGHKPGVVSGVKGVMGGPVRVS